MKGRSFGAMSATPMFRVDHPFLFYLVDYKFGEDGKGDQGTVLDKKLSFVVAVMSGRVVSP
jgi:hypothetical protein